MSRRLFVSESIASGWQDGLCVGTGSLGAVLFGTPAVHRIVFSHEEFFLPLDAEVPRAAELAPVLAEIRRLVSQGDDTAASAVVESAARASGVARDIMPLDPFVPLACLSISTQVMDAMGPDETAGYRRSGRFDDGSARAEWLQGDGTVALDVTPDRQAGLIRVRVSSTVENSIELRIGLSADQSTNIGKVTVVDFRDRVTAELQTEAARLSATVRPRTLPIDGSRPVAGVVDMVVVTGATTRVGDHLEAVVGPDADLVIEVSASVERSAPLPNLPSVLATGRDDHTALFEACALDLGSGVPDELPTEQLLTRARAGEPEYERAAVEFAFAAGRSAIIASTGELPPNLVGVWQGSWAPAWSGDYTLNGNVQLGAMAGMFNTGTPELLRSLFRLHLRFLDQFEENAERLFGAGGYALPTHQSGHAHANHHSTTYPHIFWYGSGAWALRAAFDYFSCTGDTQFVADVAWPFARKVMQFLLDVRVVDESGRSHFVPSYSPENTPDGAATGLSIDATMDLSLARDATRIACAFAAVVGDDSLTAAWTAFAESLPAYRVEPRHGHLAEWAHPDVPENLAHRHASQLYAYWYDDGDDATDASIDAAALALVRAKTAWRAEAPYGPPGNQEMAFGLSSIGIAAARLRDAESAYQCAIWLARDHVEANAMSRHDQGSIFNVDACGALPALVAEMLVSSSPGRIAILPALPAEWPSGSVRGITGRGGVIVDELVWSADEVNLVLRRRPGSMAAWVDPALAIELPTAIVAPGSDARTVVVIVDVDEQPRRLVVRRDGVTLDGERI